MRCDGRISLPVYLCCERSLVMLAAYGIVALSVIYIIVLGCILMFTRRDKKQQEEKYLFLRASRDRLWKIQELLLNATRLSVSEELVDKKQWEDAVMILSLSEYLNEVDRVPFETTVAKWVDRLSQELSDIKAGRASWNWGTVMGQPPPTVVCPLIRVGDVSLFFPYLTQLVAELNLLDPEKSKLDNVTLAKRAEYNDLLAHILVQQSVASR